MSRFNYWRESLEGAINECGVTLTPEQLDSIAGDLEMSAENESLARGPTPPNPLERELSELKRHHAAAMERLENDARRELQDAREVIRSKQRTIDELQWKLDGLQR